ncbi:MAG: hypothetical protein KDA28_00100 [Phycisphaerales bacterium]|nr:hypothetical protein [Phycisphaerales bacterium]
MSNDLGITYEDVKGRRHRMSITADTSPTIDEVNDFCDLHAGRVQGFVEGRTGLAITSLTVTKPLYRTAKWLAITEALIDTLSARGEDKQADREQKRAEAEWARLRTYVKSEVGDDRPTGDNAPGLLITHQRRREQMKDDRYKLGKLARQVARQKL